MNEVAQWTRPLWTPGGASAEVAVVAFSEAPLPSDFTLDEERDGAPRAGIPEQLDLRTVSAEDNPDWVRGFFEGALFESAWSDLGWEEAPVAKARFAHYVSGSFPDPKDLDHLQATWALLRALAEAGSFAMLDLRAARGLPAEVVTSLPREMPFDLDREITIIIETQSSEPGPLLCHTRGMRKLGRPDLLMLLEGEQDGDEAAALVHALAESLALGAQVGVGDTFKTEDGIERPFLAYAPGEAHPQVHLENVGLVIGEPG